MASPLSQSPPPVPSSIRSLPVQLPVFDGRLTIPVAAPMMLPSPFLTFSGLRLCSAHTHLAVKTTKPFLSPDFCKWECVLLLLLCSTPRIDLSKHIVLQENGSGYGGVGCDVCEGECRNSFSIQQLLLSISAGEGRAIFSFGNVFLNSASQHSHSSASVVSKVPALAMWV